MHTFAELREETNALLQETEQQVAQLRQQRMLLECLKEELLKQHARLKQLGIGSEKLLRALAAHGCLPSTRAQR